jgi:hypothetical protein
MPSQRDDVITLAICHTLIMTIGGVAAGLVAAAALTRYLHALLFGIALLDPMTFIAAPVVLCGRVVRVLHASSSGDVD